MISLPRLKALLRITTSDDDALLTELVEQAVATAGTIANRHFGLPQARQEYQDGLGTDILPLRAMPYTATSSPEITVTEQTAPSLNVVVIVDTAVDGWELRTGPRNAWLKRAGGYVWTDGKEYVLDYTEGYDEDGLPADVEEVITGMVGRRYEYLDDEGLKSETLGQYSRTRFSEGDLAPLERETLLAWREPVHA